MKKHCMIFWRRIRPRILNKGDADEKQIGVIGGGAAGMMAAITAAKRRRTGDDPGA